MRENEAFQAYTSLLNTFGLNHHEKVAVSGAISSELNRAEHLSLRLHLQRERLCDKEFDNFPWCCKEYRAT